MAIRPRQGVDYSLSGLDPWKAFRPKAPMRRPLAEQKPLWNETKHRHVTPGREEEARKINEAVKGFAKAASYATEQGASHLGGKAKSELTPKQRAAWAARAARERGE
jgi:hypothetical protein